jgi:hypothetical protein
MQFTRLLKAKLFVMKVWKITRGNNVAPTSKTIIQKTTSASIKGIALLSVHLPFASGRDIHRPRIEPALSVPDTPLLIRLCCHLEMLSVPFPAADVN